jgi:tetratricopeptide (TPR) repeat protein
MTFLKRLRFLPAVLGVAATIAAVSTTLLGDIRTDSAPTASQGQGRRPEGAAVAEELAVAKFGKLPILTYELRAGDMLFAWQVKPNLEPAAPRPRDFLILVDTSASQSGLPLKQARQIISALATSLSPNDRISVWSISTPSATRALTRDFQPANADEVRHAAAALTEVEYGSGATDLKSGLRKALATLAPNRSRHQIVLYLGDGESAFDPISEDDRVALGNQMEMRDVYFFAVPLSIKVNPQNLHGLASMTGGAVVRLQEDLNNPNNRAEFLNRLKAALNTPVLKVEKFQFGEEVGEAYPTRLPPLRGDRSTLVMGKLAKAAAPAISLTIAGNVYGRPTTQNLSQAVPASQVDHYFLNLMLEQWRSAPHKDAPAMLQSDRALALASTQVKLYRDEFLVQAVWAVRMDKWDDAAKLYQAAQRIDPNDPEAAAGLALLEKLRTGKVSKADLEQKIAAKSEALKVAPDAVARTVVQNVAKQDPAPAGGDPPQAAQDLLKEAAARRQVEEQRYRVLVDATIRRARQLMRSDPDTAYQDLKRQRDEIASYDGIGGTVRTQLVADLESVMREIFVKGAEIKRQAAAEREAVAKTRQRLNEFDRAMDEVARTKNRIDMFRQLMQRARFELAYQEAQLMVQEHISAGKPVPITATASYIIGQQATHLREWRELVRIRQDRYLLSMMQSEKSFIPYPDEPPVHFPPAAVWRELTSLRKETYENSNLGNNPTQSQIDLKNKIENQEVLIEKNLNETTLYELLLDLSKKYNVTFVIMEEYFKNEGIPDIRDRKPTLTATQQLRGLKLGTFLDIVLLSMNATFIVRPDYVEITTFNRRLEEKVTRVFPVADLVIPIPSSVNQATLFQNLFFQNQQLAIFGQVLGSATFQGFGNAFGGQQGNQQFGGGPMGPGGLGGGPLGQQGGGQFGPPPGGGNVGFGAGGLQVGGGNLGQFGNLGGQFGLQGGDQSQLLMNLIVETVARGEWTNVRPPGAEPGPADEDLPDLPRKQLNSLGYYPPARALIIRGTSRYHPATTIKLIKGDNGQALANPNPRPGGPIVIGPGSGTNPVNPNQRPKDPVVVNPPKDPNTTTVVSAEAGKKPTLVDPKIDPIALKKNLSTDPKRMWNEAIDWTISDPGIIVASAEFLMEMDEYGAAAEILKGGLRKGLVTDEWAHDALAIALQMSQAAPDEIERAALSAIDLDPTDAKAYLKAARVEADLKHHDQAIAFCKRAAQFSPDEPTAYANVLAYAELATDVKTDAVLWAANNLLRRDWNVSDGIDYHKEVSKRLPRLAAKFAAAGGKTDALRKTLTEQTQRDLIIQLLWQGSADLDLVVSEPSGSVCSPTHKRTTGGGVLKPDILEQLDNGRSEEYTAAMAFKGTYTITVKKVLGRPTGDTATLKITRFQGTPKESHDLITIDLANPKPVQIHLDEGSRTELASVPDDDDLNLRASTTGAVLAAGPSGLGGGFGSMTNGPIPTSGGPNLPIVNPATETRLPGVGSAADLRASVKVNPDRQTMSFHVNPVFSTAKGVKMPKVPLLPGGDGP